MFFRIGGWLILSFILAGCSSQAEEQVPEVAPTKTTQQPPVADRVFINGNIYRFNWPAPQGNGKPHRGAPFGPNGWWANAQAIAVSGGKVLAVGANDDVRHYITELTEVVDLKNATVLPGLIDSHVHIEQLAEKLAIADLAGVDTPQQAVARLTEFVRLNPLAPNEWLLGDGWDEGRWAAALPTRHLLDAAFPERPVVLKSRHGFAVWANSAALLAAGISAQVPDPVGGEIVRDADGNPSGILLNRATPLMLQKIPVITAKQYQQRLLKAMQVMANSGFVAIHQAGADQVLLQHLQILAEQGQLPLRVYVYLSSRDQPLMSQWLARGPEVDPNGWLDVRGVKAYYDGSLGARGALLLEPYSDKPGHLGTGGPQYQYPAEQVEQAFESGFQLAIHAIGDGGNRAVLDIFARQQGLPAAAHNRRHRIEHAQVLAPSDIPRLGQLGVLASMEPLHALSDRHWALQRLGTQRIDGAYAWRSLRESGATLLLNSDLPGTDYQFKSVVYAAITRQDEQQLPSGGWYPQQRLSVEEAIWGYSRAPAFAMFREQQLGQISPGFWADFTVVDQDIMRLAANNAEQILSTQILMTVIHGRQVFLAPTQ